jgi:hypothetical protein
MDIDRAEAIAHVAQTIISTGRLECDYLEILGGGRHRLSAQATTINRLPKYRRA